MNATFLDCHFKRSSYKISSIGPSGSHKPISFPSIQKVIINDQNKL